MNKQRVTFAWLRQLLLDLGFTETVVPKSHIGFHHKASGAEVFLPIYRSNQMVMPHHLLTVRFTLDSWGVMDATQFDEAVASASTKQTAS